MGQHDLPPDLPTADPPGPGRRGRGPRRPDGGAGWPGGIPGWPVGPGDLGLGGSAAGFGFGRGDARAGLAERLLEERVVLLSGEFDAEAANLASIGLMMLDATGDEFVDLQIDCHGGTLDSALALMDVVELLGVDVHATAIGQVSGPAVGVLAVAAVRQATPHARLRLTEPDSTFAGPARQLEAWVEDNRRQVRRFCERLADATGRTADAIGADLASGRYLDAEEAVRYGLVDQVCRPLATVHRLRPQPFGFRRST